MDANAFRFLYEYHFSENRKTWNYYIRSLSDEQFTQESGYSIGSIRNHVVHLMRVDDDWFTELRGLEVTGTLDPADFTDRDVIRARWDAIEQTMRGYLENLRDDMLFNKPVAEGEDKDLMVWQMLIHVVTHGMDHRAQILRLLYDVGVRTGPQDFMFYVYENP
jgi:uncharacterized damage-inducible protein DinB